MVIIFCGAPGAGKTTIAKRLLPKLRKIGSAEIFTSDELKPPVYEKFLKLLPQNQGKFDFLVFDATFFKKAHREAIKSLAGREKTITVFFDVSLKTALQRNKERKANIPEQGLQAMFEKMEKPDHPDIYINTEKISADESADKIFNFIKKKRIFVAIATSKKLQDIILEWEKSYRSPSRQMPVRWLSPKNLHITLIPPWYEKDIAKVFLRLENIKSQAFKISFEKVRFGPDPKRPRLIWAEGNAPEALLGLKTALEKALHKKSERRPWKTHLTIARFRPEDFSGFSIKKLDETVHWEEDIKSFVVMESHLSSKGAEYEILKEYDFKK